MTELDYIIDLHINNDRQGPGNEASTLFALEHLDLSKRDQLKVADIGCGTGAQSLALAKHLNGKIIALDLFPEFLNKLEERAQQEGLSNKIQTIAKSMDDLPFEKNELDLIWSEGAIYNIGFENGIKRWREYLKPGGFLAISEITWLTQARPEAIDAYWQNEYPQIATASHKIEQLERNAYSLVGYFYLKQDAWIEHYYKTLEAGFEAFLLKHKHADLAKKVVEDNKAEIELYLKFKEYYSYGFYLAQKMQ